MHAVMGDGEIILDPQWNENDIVKMVPGSGYRTKTKTWHVPLTWASMVALRGLFGASFTYDDEITKFVWHDRQTRIDPALAWRFAIDAPPNPDDSLTHEMFSFQRADVEFMRAAGSGLLGNSAGTGKTIALLSLLRSYENDWDAWENYSQIPEQDPRALPALVICPNAVKHHWAARLAHWLPSATPYVIDGTLPVKRGLVETAKQDPSALVIINYESVRLLSRLAPYGSIKLRRCLVCEPKFGEDIKASQCHVHPKELNGFGFRTVVMDEAHMIGVPDSQQTRAVCAIAHDPSVRYRWAATGTPDNVKRLWSIMHAVAPAEYPTRTKWMDRYGLQAFNAFGGTDVIGYRPDTRDEAFTVLDPRFRRMIKEVVLPQLPPLVREIRYIDMPVAQRKMYAELDKHLHTRLPDGTLLVTENKLIARVRLMQFATAPVSVEKPDEDDISTWVVHMHEKSAKLDAMMDVLDDMGDKPFVVACVHREVAIMASERLANRNIRHALIMGGSSTPAENQTYTEQLKTGEIRAIVFTSAAGGTGLDMSGVDTMIRVQRPDSLIQCIQTEERISRIGSERHTSLRVVDLVTDGTVEVRQVEKLHQKLEQLDEITRDRAQIAKHLQKVPPGTTEFGELVGRMTALNTTMESLTATDEYDWEEL